MIALALLALAAALCAHIVRSLAATSNVPVGRHRPDTVRRRPAGWMPPTGAARLRALADTQQMEAIR